MDDEFKLCWKNFQDNIASGFQNLYDRGDLVDVTLACDGKLLHAHKIVLAICSPYFQEIFITNPCKHPIIILKDVTFNIMCELLEFMYQGVVNVKHTELQSFMKIGQLLQIKGLATNASSTAAGTSSTDNKSASQAQNIDETSSVCADTENNSSATTGGKTKTNRTGSASGEVNTSADGPASAKLSNPISVKSNSPASSPSPMGFNESSTAINQQSFKNSPDQSMPLHPNYHASASLKRHLDLNNDALSIYSRKQFRRSITSAEHNTDHSDSADADGESDYFLPSIPHLATNSSAAAAAAAFRGTFNPAAFGFDYNLYKNSGPGGVGASGIGGACGGNTPGGGGSTEYPNDLHIPSDYSKNFANHVDIPPIAPGEHWFHGKLEFMLSQRGKPLLVHDGHTFGIQYVRKDKKYWQCNLSRKFNCKARVTTTDTGEIIVTNNEHCHTEIRQHLRKDYQRNKVMMNALLNLSTNMRRQSNNGNSSNSLNNLSNFSALASHGSSLLSAAATAAAIVAPGSAVLHNYHNENADLQQQHHHHHQQQQQQQQQQHIPGAVDFTKDRGTNTPPSSRATPNAHNQTMLGENPDNSRPLDCGFRQTTPAMGPNEFENEMNNRDNNYNGAGWKCKNEIGDS